MSRRANRQSEVWRLTHSFTERANLTRTVQCRGRSPREFRMNSRTKSTLTPAGVAGRLAQIAVYLLTRAQSGAAWQDQRLVAKAFYSLAAAATQVPTQVAAEWTSVLYGSIAFNAGDPTPLDFKRRAESLHRYERETFNAVFTVPPTPQGLLKILKQGSGLLAGCVEDADLTDRAYGLALLVLSEMRFLQGMQGDTGLLRGLFTAREAAYGEGVGGLSLWEAVNRLREVCDRASVDAERLAPPALVVATTTTKSPGAWR